MTTSLLVVLLVIVVLLFVVLLLLEALEACNGNSVQISHTILADPSTSLGVLLQNADSLKSLNSLSLD